MHAKHDLQVGDYVRRIPEHAINNCFSDDIEQVFQVASFTNRTSGRIEIRPVTGRLPQASAYEDFWADRFYKVSWPSLVDKLSAAIKTLSDLQLTEVENFIEEEFASRASRARVSK